MNTILTVNGLKKSYNDKTVVKGVSFEVEEGEIFGILGPNGAGKTTTLEMIEALRPIDEGTITLDGIDVHKHPHKVKEIIGIQLQSSSFYTKMTLAELLRLFASLYGRTVNPNELLEEVGLADKASSYPENLSGGQRQRFSITTALVNNPRVLFLDEPTTGLDPQARRHLWELIEGVKKKGITVILTTHYLEIAMDTPHALVKDLLGRGFTKSQHVEQASLEDVFIDLTGKALRD
jgi:ABC-2 type transport system ATP-binding protein